MAHATGTLVFVLLLVAGSIASATSEGQKLFRLGGWRPISNPRDHKVLEIAEFAVREHNKLAKTNLKLQSVISGAIQVVGGRIYRLVVSAVDATSPANYLALVYEKPWQHLNILIRFQKVATK
ncbi:cysteine proteinase inhibitor 1-like [Sesamum indicum]|uniref:Cysteine proteinase inhibitor 1-like n=1 Tax=Sesamum indicum TaxID=4182 RepID=A0A6I9U5X9_SESIN|nr:cysteine proteinase inhibitor 1-like [Sesamum indicum]